MPWCQLSEIEPDLMLSASENVEIARHQLERVVWPAIVRQRNAEADVEELVAPSDALAYSP